MRPDIAMLVSNTQRSRNRCIKYKDLRNGCIKDKTRDMYKLINSRLK